MDQPDRSATAAAERPDHFFAKIGRLVIIPLGGLMVLGAAYSAWSTWTWLKTAVEAEGTVVEMVRMVSTTTVEDPFDRSKRTVANGYVYAPLVRFRSRDGHAIEFQSTLRSNPPGYVAGQTVTVLYDPKAPNAAEVRGFAATWLGAIILGFIGTAFAAFGAVFVVVGNNLAKHIEANRMAAFQHPDPRALWEDEDAADAVKERMMSGPAITPAVRP